MKYAFFQGCNIPTRAEQYATATTAVLNSLGVTLQVVRDFNCCGYPARNVDEKAYILPSVRNIAIAEKLGLDIMVICNCCFASLQKVKNLMAGNDDLKAELNTILAKEGLQYSGQTEIKHFLSILHEDVGVAAIKNRLVHMVSDLAVAVIQGCHILRPREITTFDNSFVPRITENILQVTGANNLEWQGKLECCGAALMGLNNDLARTLLDQKIVGAKAAGADFIVPICSYCHLQFDTTQMNMAREESDREILPVLLLPQLLGLCLGINEQELGIRRNSTVSQEVHAALLARVGPVVEEKKKRKKKAKSTA